jgi:hypothetical protein
MSNSPDGARRIVVLLFGFTDLEKQISANCKPVFIKGIGMMCSMECDLGQFEDLVSGSTYNMQFECLRPYSNRAISHACRTTSGERRKAAQMTARPCLGQEGAKAARKGWMLVLMKAEALKLRACLKGPNLVEDGHESSGFRVFAPSHDTLDLA